MKIQVNEVSIDILYAENSVAVYNCVVDVIRMTKTTTARGISEEPVTLVNLMPCNIDWMSGSEKMLSDKVTHYRDATLFCRKPAGVTIVVSDLVYYEDKRYEIVDIRNVNNLNLLLEIDIKRIE